MVCCEGQSIHPATQTLIHQRFNTLPLLQILFLVNRYLMLVISVIILVGFRLNWPTERCQSYYIPWQTILPVIVAAAGSVILLLRAYAVVSRHWLSLLEVCMLKQSSCTVGPSTLGAVCTGTLARRTHRYQYRPCRYTCDR